MQLEKKKKKSIYTVLAEYLFVALETLWVSRGVTLISTTVHEKIKQRTRADMHYSVDS